MTASNVRWCGAFLLSNVVNWAMSVVQVVCMPVWSFYDKTNIVILTCTTDIFPPVLPTCLWLLLLIKWGGRVCAAGAAQGCCQAYDTGSMHFVPSVEVKMSYMSVR